MDLETQIDPDFVMGPLLSGTAAPQ